MSKQQTRKELELESENIKQKIGILVLYSIILILSVVYVLKVEKLREENSLLKAQLNQMNESQVIQEVDYHSDSSFFCQHYGGEKFEGIVGDRAPYYCRIGKNNENWYFLDDWEVLE